MSYSWQGRCYEQKYGNQELTDIYLVFEASETEYASHADTIQNVIGSKILAVEKYYDGDWDYQHVTFIVKDEYRDEVIAEVEKYFKYA